ncbi:hypothetical protein EOPP23_21010 [Endozoicomonas sp. OPT23]|uniref:sensor domain-containing phosphodiesterase n=1 Tax=Endozoicomonas sp. OPT23 TaxID=2072845 RepID=UPI00129AC3CA|nr:sensor domain-containing phosphodiesterase [Endozoicomonas sp. OPT23]MRI35444.1 hypothetical protein [Endozoicomonas sp. OPT23]
MNNTTRPVRLLTLEKSRNDAERWVKLFRAAGKPARVQQINSVEELEEALVTGLWDLLLSVEETPMVRADQAIACIKRLKLDVPVILSVEEKNSEVVKHWLDLGAADIIHTNHEEHMLHAILREITSLGCREQILGLKKNLLDTEQRCQLLMDNASHAIAYVHEGMHIDANQPYLELFGYNDPDDLAGMPLIDMVTSGDQPLFKSLIKHFKPGQEQPAVNCQLIDTSGDSFEATVILSEAVFEDEPCVQVLVKAAAQPTNLSSPSESLPTLSRNEFLAQLESGDQAPEILAYLQLENYDEIRKNTGIEGSIAVQDTLLELLASQLTESQVAHYGDEVYLIAVNQNELAALTPLLGTIDKALISAGSQTIYTTASIGLAEKSQDDSEKNFLERAQFACQLAIEHGGNRIETFSQKAIDVKKASNGDMLALIRQALENDSFRLTFQPVISVTGEGLNYYEVLLRMLDQNGKEIPAAEFIASAEESDMMPFIDRWVVRNAIKQLAKKFRKGDNSRMMVHISQASLEDKAFAEQLARLLSAAELPGHMLTLQMTERMVQQHLKQVIKFVEQLKPLGCKFAMVQFSGEPRSLKVLEHLDIPFVKLDSLFTEKLERNDDSQLKKVSNNLKKLNKVIIMPKVESAQTLTSIWQMGVDYVQGYYLQPPMESMTYDFSS